MPEQSKGLTRLYVYYKVAQELKEQALQASAGVISQMQRQYDVVTELQIRADRKEEQLTVMEAYLFDAGCETEMSMQSLGDYGELAFADFNPSIKRHLEWFETVGKA